MPMPTRLPRCARAAILIPIIIITVFLSGCSPTVGIYANYRAMEELQTVQALALDWNVDGTVTLTAAVQRAGDDSGDAPTVLSADGSSIPEALTQLQRRTGQGELFFAHIRYLLLGQALAEHGIAQVLDYVERDVHTRMAAELFLLRDDRAEALFAAVGDGSAVTELLSSVRRDAELRGGSRVYSVRSTAVALSEYGAAPICALRTVPAPEGSGGTATVLPDGCGILRGGMLAGFLDGRDAEVLRLLTGEAGTVSRSFPDGDDSTVTLELRGSADLSCPEPSVTEIALKIDAVIAAVSDPQAPVTDGAYLSRLCDTVSAELEAQALRILELTKSTDADFLALARPLRRCMGTDSLPSDWLRQTQFRLHTEVSVSHSYDLSEQPGTEGVA